MRRERRKVPGLSEGQRIYFLYDEDMMDGITAGFKSTDDMRECYLTHREQIISERIDFHPCSRPSAWWRWDKGMSRPKHPNDDFLDPWFEAETLRDLEELTPIEYQHLQTIREFYGQYRDLEDK